MAKSKIESDAGLNLRMVITGLLLVILYAVIVGVLLSLGVSTMLVVVLAGAMLFSQYFFSDKIAMFSMKAHEVTPAEEPQLHAIVDHPSCLACDSRAVK